MAANPAHRLSRRDVRPPAGANPEIPGFAKNDHVLNKWVLEERARRRRFLADQVLEACEPFEPVRHPHPIFKPFYNAYTKFSRATSWRFHPFLKNTAFCFVMFVIPIWAVTYKEKQWKGTDKLFIGKVAKYPEQDLAPHGHHH